MYYKLCAILMLTLSVARANSQQTPRDSFRLFFLGGQSNMTGYGYNDDLPESLILATQGVWIFQGNPEGDEEENGGRGIWEVLKPGHGRGFSTDGASNNLSDRFGLELSFAKRIKELYPNDKVAIIKYAKSGSSIDSMAARRFGSWDPDYKGKTGINQYDHYLMTVANALSIDDIDRDGISDSLIPSGIIWMQGESDANMEEVALRYFDNLKRLMALMRASFLKDDLPIVIGKISDSGKVENGKVWKYGEVVQFAQERYALSDKKVSIVRSTQYYDYSDRHHYDSKGYIDLGERFAEAIYELDLK